jgi:hypothetical protein
MKKTTSIFIFLLVLAGWAVFGGLGPSWGGWAPATCLASGCFCEAVHPGAIAQPVNSWSSLAFVLPGLLVLTQAHRKQAHPVNFFNSRPVYGRVLGAALIVTGIGSAFYHASLTFTGQFLDVLGMYLFISFALIYALARFFQFSTGAAGASYLAVNLLLAASLIWLPGIRREVFAGLVLATIAAEGWLLWLKKPAIQARWFLGAIGSMAAAYLIWILDNARLVCWPESWLQGHAIWHLLGALAAWLLVQYYQSEKI